MASARRRLPVRFDEAVWREAVHGPPTERPFAFVLQLARERDAGLMWAFVAFGHRHPAPRRAE